jgi:hypothetical protein
MRRAFSFLFLLMVPFLVWPSHSRAFDYKECVASGKGTNHQRMGGAEWQKIDETTRRMVCARISDEVEAQESLRHEQQRVLREQQKQIECAQTGTCASDAEIREQIRRSQQEHQRTPASAGRAADSKNRFVLLDEVKEPPSRRQPEVAFGTHPDSANRYVRVAAEGLTAPREIQVVCDQETRRIPLTTASMESGRTVAVYEASRATVSVALASQSCDLVIVGARLSIPHERLTAVWGNTKR